MIETFYPGSFLDPAANKNERSTGLIILNQPIADKMIFEKVWNYTGYHVCADGGANRLYDIFGDDEIERRKFVPALIIGDFDSIRPEIKRYYETLGVKTIKHDSQYSTDFMKSAHALNELAGVKVIYAIGANGGRVDQEFHALHHLYLSRQQGQTLYLVSAPSVSFLIPGSKEVIIETPMDYLGETCGVIPLEGSTRITTKGLKWDVTDWETSFETKISTSNHLAGDEVRVKADKGVLFTVEIRGVEK